MWLIFGRGKDEIRVRVSERDVELTLKRFSVEGAEAGLECHFCAEVNYECMKCRLERQLPKKHCFAIRGLEKANIARSKVDLGWLTRRQRKSAIAILRNFRKRIRRAVERGKKRSSN